MLENAHGYTRRQVLAGGGALGVGVALAPLLSACGSESSSSSSLTIAVTSRPGSWDQDYLAFDTVGLALMRNYQPYMLDHPTHPEGDARVEDTTKLIPVFAESWKASADGRIWTLRLKRGIKFPSGNPLTAHDVKWSKDRAFAAKANVAGLYALIGLTKPEQVEVVDDYTVRFHQAHASGLTDAVQAICLYVFDSKLMKEHASDGDPWAKQWAARNPTNGGVYNVTSQRSGGAIELERNPEFPGRPKPQVENVRVLVAPSSSSQRLQLESGDVDIALGLSRRDITQLKDSDGIEVLSFPSSERLDVQLDVTKPPFHQVEVRRALAHAVPNDEIIKTVFDGDARRVKSLVPIDMPGYDDTSYPYEYDPAQAKAMLRSAGADGLSSTLTIAQEAPEDEQVAILLRDALGEVGAGIEIERLDAATLNDRRAKKTLPMQLTTGQYWVNDVEYEVGTSFIEGAFLNYANYSNPTIERLQQRVSRITDEQQRLAIFRQMQKILGADVPWLALCQPNASIPMRSSVSGWVQTVDGLFRLQGLRRS
jgi:peptide/nickel transport system substrate-binding protein